MLLDIDFSHHATVLNDVTVRGNLVASTPFLTFFCSSDDIEEHI